MFGRCCRCLCCRRRRGKRANEPPEVPAAIPEPRGAKVGPAPDPKDERSGDGADSSETEDPEDEGVARSYSTHRLQVSNLPHSARALDVALLFPEAHEIRILQPSPYGKFKSCLPVALVRFSSAAECRRALVTAEAQMADGALFIAPKLKLGN